MKKILMIAPEPYFEPRGTPFSEYFRIKALTELGHQVDLVTYPIGQDRGMPGLRIYRSWRVPGIKTIKTGPSWQKVVLDFFLFFKAWARLLGNRYDLIHTHEEACIMGVFFSKITRIPHLYDMHASLVQHMDNFKFTRSKLITGFFSWIERTSLKNAASVIVICPSLADYAGKITDPGKLTMIENFSEEQGPELDAEKLQRLRRELADSHNKVVLYTGTLEAYQGIPLLLEALSLLPLEYKLVLIGGTARQIEQVQGDLDELGLKDRVILLGRQDPAEIPYFLKAADVLVSPRTLGTNIPLKIYSYLRSGVPVVATDLYTHTQSITPEIAVLATPRKEELAGAIVRAAGPEGLETAVRAARFCERHYSQERYQELVRRALETAFSN